MLDTSGLPDPFCNVMQPSCSNNLTAICSSEHKAVSPPGKWTAPKTSVQDYRKAFDTYPGQGRLFRGRMRGEATEPLDLLSSGY